MDSPRNRVVTQQAKGMMYVPEKCLRGLTTCVPLAQIVADDEASFFCCGENDGSDRSVAQDKYTTCFKGPHRDEMSHNDKRDLIHNAAVLVQALAIIENDEYNNCDETT